MLVFLLSLFASLPVAPASYSIPDESRSLPSSAPQEKESFEAALEKLHRYIGQRRWKEAEAGLNDILSKNERADWAYSKRAILLEDAKKIAFWKTAEIPDLQNLVSGDLKTYKPGKTAKIKLLYEAGGFQDFEVSRERWYHPVRFDGPFTIKIEGQSYPWSRPPYLIFGDGDSNALPYKVSFGTPFGNNYFPARIYRWDGEVNQELDILDSIPAKSGKPFSLEVKVTAKKISVKQQKKKILESKRDKKADYGTFRIGGFAEARLSTISIEGEVQTSWMDNLIDDAMQEQRRAFEFRYKPSKSLPGWLLEENEEVEEDPGVNRNAPAPNPIHLHRAWDQAFLAIRKGRTADAVTWLLDLQDEELPESHRAYLLSQLYYQLGKFPLALEQCRLVIEEDPNFMPSRIDEGWLMHKVDRQACFEVMEKVAQDFPNTLRPSKEYLDLLLIESRLAQAREFVESIAVDRPRSPLLDSLMTILVKANNGPDFTKSTEYSTEHYVVQTDMNREICIEAAKQLERMFRAYKLHLKGLPDKKKQKFKVYLFSGESGFQRYAADVLGGGHPNAAGLYSPVVKQLLIWNLPQRDEMFRTVQHEGFHQYLDRMMPDPPVWFNEGAASYFELAGYPKGKWKEGQIDASAVELLRNKGLLPLRDYIRLSNREFRIEGLEARNYAQGWLLTHFLRNSNKANLNLFKKLFDQLCEAEDGQRCVDELFADLDLAKLDREFREHLAAM